MVFKIIGYLGNKLMFVGYLGENLMGYGYGKVGFWVGNLLIIICNWKK